MSFADGAVGLAADAEVDSELCPGVSFRVLVNNIPIRFSLVIFGICIAEEQLAATLLQALFHFVPWSGSTIIVEKIIAVYPVFRAVIFFQKGD